MSGGGGGGGGTGGPDIIIDTLDPCEDVDFTANLQSPNALAIAQVNVGQHLEVILQGAAVAVVSTSGTAVGFLLNQYAQLRRCLQAGEAFDAEVLSIAGGSVRVRVRHV